MKIEDESKPGINGHKLERINNLSEHSISLTAKMVARKISSFDHFIYLWGTKANYYLPPKHCLTWRFISQVLAAIRNNFYDVIQWVIV